MLAEIKYDDQSDFQSVDVSKPSTPRREADIAEEEAAIKRSAWLRTHMKAIFAAVGVVFVAVIVAAILLYARHANPLSRLIQAGTKNFNTTYDFQVALSVSDKPVMNYKGSMDVDRQAHRIRSVYNADYGDYTYTGALCTLDNNAYKGNFYQEKWTIEDCTAQTHDFFDFEGDLARGDFDSGAMLRFLGITSEFSAEEVERFESRLRQRLSGNSTLATITSAQKDGGMEYSYDIKLSELMKEIAEDGAPLFYHSTDYDSFKLRYEANKKALESAGCTMQYLINAQGYLTSFRLTVTTGGESYSLDCSMSGFGSVEVKIPEAFLTAVSEAKEQ